MVLFKQITTGQGAQVTTSMRPVLIRIPLTPEQTRIVLRYTGTRVVELELTEAELKALIAGSVTHIMDPIDRIR